MIVTVDSWSDQAARARQRLGRRFRAEGRHHPELAAALVVARGGRGDDAVRFAAELGCDAELVVALERGAEPPWRAPAAVRRLLQAVPDRRRRARGCLLAGAVGDALGAGIEFQSLDELRRQHGEAGVTGFVPAYGRTGAITDDTQMTLFTAEGLLHSAVVGGDTVSHLHRAYQRWLATQDGGPAPGDPGTTWLYGHPFLHHRRAPGTTCLTALHTGVAGTVDRPGNDSKGCGGVMRAAPAGIVATSLAEAFDLGVTAAAITHGHPSGYLAAGVLAAVVWAVLDGVRLDDAVPAGLAPLRSRPGGDEVDGAVRTAVALAAEPGPPTADRVEELGAGWVAEEALAIGVYCALAMPDVRAGLLLAVNHGGDSDSTGSIAGNLLGAAYGDDLVPGEWLDGLEGGDVIAAVADDLADRGGSHPERYGG